MLESARGARIRTAGFRDMITELLGLWLLLGLMALTEAVFIFWFLQLARQARNRRAAQ